MPGEHLAEKIPAANPETKPINLEKPNSPEKILEKPIPRSEKVADIPVVSEKPLNVSNQTSGDNWQAKRAVAIDSILSEGLDEVFLSLKPQEQAHFKKEGEETVKKINRLLSETKVKINKIMDLIRRWLRLIPRVNRYFLEQETKIKTDKIIGIKNKF